MIVYLPAINIGEFVMATITLTTKNQFEYDAVIAFLKALKIRCKISDNTANNEALEIAQSVEGVKNGTIATRPLSVLLKEL
jgi:hypothetical protein